jgi:hypothetical protein
MTNFSNRAICGKAGFRRGLSMLTANFCRARLQPCHEARRIKAALQAAEKVVYFVISSEARNLSLLESQEKRDSSARSAPRNDKNVSFSAACLAAGRTGGAR